MMMKIESISDAINTLKTLPPETQQEVFQYIDFLSTRHHGVDLNNDSHTQNQEPKERQFGQLKGKGSFVIKDDFKMTAEELCGYE